MCTNFEHLLIFDHILYVFWLENAMSSSLDFVSRFWHFSFLAHVTFVIWPLTSVKFITISSYAQFWQTWYPLHQNLLRNSNINLDFIFGKYINLLCPILQRHPSTWFWSYLVHPKSNSYEFYIHFDKLNPSILEMYLVIKVGVSILNPLLFCSDTFLNLFRS